MTGYALSGICNPMMGLGNLGLGASGTYASYDPYTSGLYGGYGMGGYGMYGGYGNYDSLFNMYQNMQKMQQNMEISNANHTNTMNGIMNNNEVSAVGNAQSALISKISQNGSVMTLLGNLIDKVHKGELDGVCSQYKDLKNQIYATYRDELAARGEKENPERAVREIIDTLYTQKMASSGVANASLRDDIKKYGDSAFMNGFQQALKEGHDTKYVDEALYEIYREDITNQKHNESNRSAGMFVGGFANSLKKGATIGGIAAVTGLGATGIIKGGATLVGMGSKINHWKFAKNSLRVAGIVALCTSGYYLIKSILDSSKNEAQNQAA